jgi:hypothetical protein
MTLKSNADQGGTTLVSILQFDDRMNWVTTDTNPRFLNRWHRHDFNPRGSTAMNDAILNAINHLKTKRETENTGYLVCVISDGEENSSRNPAHVVSQEIRRLQNTEKWTFTFLLANQDIHDVAERLGVYAGNMQAFVATHAGVGAASVSNSVGLQSYFSARADGKTNTSSFFNPMTADFNG